MPEAVLGLGGNLGARRAIFDAALALLSALPGCTLLARSSLYETPPLGPPQPDFLNAAVRVRFEGTAQQLLAGAQGVEAALGRERRVRWGARTVDLDVLHWSEGPVRSHGLEIPHRELGTRTFALAPLLDVAPELASTWHGTLAKLGGAPALARPGWSALVREGAYLCGDWQHDDAELASQLAELAGRALSFLDPREAYRGARESADGAPGASDENLVTHAFTGPGELFDSEGRTWLETVVQAAHARGFRVRGAAVIERDDTRTAGVLVGFAGGVHAPAAESPRSLASQLASILSIVLESRGDGQRRVKVRTDAPERGVDFNGSGTM
jgi:2-amino-4-hydroxy-6-hydroxymethyldihydropteridine diphosphokinase